MVDTVEQDKENDAAMNCFLKVLSKLQDVVVSTIPIVMLLLSNVCNLTNKGKTNAKIN